MQSVAVFVALVAVASAHVVYRVPSQDSAVINSQRYGGNFAYNVVEGQAYGVQSPIYSQVYSPAAQVYSPAAHVYSPAAQVYSPVSQVYSQVGASGIVQTVQQSNGQKLTYQAQAVPTTYGQTYGQVYGQNYGQVVKSPVVAQYSVPATSVVAAGTPASTYKTYAGVSPINYGYGYQYGNAVVV